MFDVALSTAGAQVVLATASDEKYPPENIIDGKADSFWTSTGLFPQEFIISFANLMNINSINVQCCNVKQLAIERSVGNEPVDFEPLGERDLEMSEGQLQREEFNISAMTACHLRFIVKSGYDHFISVHSVHVDGNAVHG